jgi:hypothetical protein
MVVFSILVPLFALSKLQKKVNDAENEKAVVQLDADRKYTIQATIVRIMKSHKTIAHKDLANAVLSQLVSFHPLLTDIKRNVDLLIEQEYMERDPQDQTIYRYIS